MKPMSQNNLTPPPVASPAFESADIKTIREFLSNPSWGTYRYMEGTEIYSDRDKALEALTRISARQAAFEVMREALKRISEDPCIGCDASDIDNTCVNIAEEALALAEAELKEQS